MKYSIFLVLLLASCETLSAPALDSQGQPIVVSDKPVVVPIGDNGDTITIQPGNTEPRPGTVGDVLTDVGSTVVGGITGQPWLAPILAGVIGILVRRKKAVA